MGGENANRAADVNTVYRLNLDNTAAGWTTRASMPQSRNHAGSFVHNNKIYIVGGQTGFDTGSSPKREIQIYDPALNSWTVSTALLPAVRSHISHSTFVHRGRVIIVGGDSAHNTATNTVWSLNPDTLQTTVLTNFPDSRLSPQVGLFNGELFVTGGYSGTIRTTAYWGTFVV
jgi:hypothetical protein